MTKFKTAESVCKGHPDKLCDLVSDSVLDACLRADRSSRVACECLATKGVLFVAGEITCSKKINIRNVARDALREAGYDPYSFIILVKVHQQSPDIAGGVDQAVESRNGDTSWYSLLGAGDQGTVYGYAVDENCEKLPAPLVYAHAICKRLDSCMRDGRIRNIGPDGKAQVTVEYEDGVPKRVKSIVVSVQHEADMDQTVLRSKIISEVLWPVFADFPFDDDTEILINPSGRFVEGGPAADTGLTGRKIQVDSYGGLGPNGGGAFSGKDPTKVDRSGAYMARAIAKNIVRAGLAYECKVAISYAIGKADPVAVDIDTCGTGAVADDVLTRAVLKVFSLRPAAIIETLGLRSPQYAETSAYGHFTNSRFRWERIGMTEELREAVRNENRKEEDK